MDVFCTGLRDPEGPALLHDGSWLVAEMHPDRGCISRVSRDGSERETIAVTGRPNGIAIAHDGTVWVAESAPPSLIAMRLDGTILQTWTGPRDEPFLWPNDLCFGADGMLYLTDSGIRFDRFAPDGEVRPDEMGPKRALISESASGRVFRLDPRSGELLCVADGLKFPNGIAIGPEGDLFVAETVSGDIQRYRPTREGLEPLGVHANVVPDDLPGAFTGPDGMAFDEVGNLYACVLGFGEVVVVDPAGAIVARWDTDDTVCTNVAFGPPGASTLYITEDVTGRIVRMPALAPGAVLHTGEPVR